MGRPSFVQYGQMKRVLTVAFTDIKAFSSLARRASRQEVLAMLDKHEELLLPIVTSYGGRVVKTLGDAFLLAFETPTDAVLAGVMMQERLRDYNGAVADDERIEVRVAINTGEVEVIGDDVYGDAVNVASRLESITEHGEVYFTESTYLAMDKAGVPTSAIGEFKVSGLPEAVTVYQVIRDPSDAEYKRLVDSQTISPDADAPEGVLSRSLLYSAEQQRLQSGSNRRYLLWGAVAMIALVLLLVGLPVARHAMARGKARKWIEQGRPEDAIELAQALREKRPSDVRLQKIIADAIVADVRQHIAAGEVVQAREAFDRYSGDFSHFDVLREVEPEVLVAEARQKDPTSQAAWALEGLARYPDNRALQMLLLEAATESGSNMQKAYETAVEMLRDDEALSEDPILIEFGRAYMNAITPKSDRSANQLTTLSDFLGSHLVDYARENLYRPGWKLARLRWSSKLLLQRQDPGSIDVFRFYSVDVFNTRMRVQKMQEEVASYFDDLLKEHTPEELKERVTFPLETDLKVLQSPSEYYYDLARKLAPLIYIDALEDELIECARSDDVNSFQHNTCFEILRETDRLDEETKLAFHLQHIAHPATLLDPLMEDTLTYLEQSPDERVRRAHGELEELVGAYDNSVAFLTKEGRTADARRARALQARIKRLLASWDRG